jgi:hypothetical protein
LLQLIVFHFGGEFDADVDSVNYINGHLEFMIEVFYVNEVLVV